jgi:hypothetical protein
MGGLAAPFFAYVVTMVCVCVCVCVCVVCGVCVCVLYIIYIYVAYASPWSVSRLFPSWEGNSVYTHACVTYMHTFCTHLLNSPITHTHTLAQQPYHHFRH